MLQEDTSLPFDMSAIWALSDNKIKLIKLIIKFIAKIANDNFANTEVVISGIGI